MMIKGAKRILAALLSLSMLISTWTPAITAEAALIKTETVNVATSGTASTSDGETADHLVSYVNDGNDATSWQTEGKWPATAMVQLAGGKKVSKVVVKLGGNVDNSTGRTALVTVKYAMNGVFDPLFEIGSKRVTVDSDVTFELSAPSSATHIFVTLSDPQNSDGSTGTFNPSVEEIEVYEEQSKTLSNYDNIANQATITASGNNENSDEPSDNLVDSNDKTLYKFYNAAMSSEQTITLAFEQARKMDAFRIAFEYKNPNEYNYQFKYSIQARNGDGEYTVIADNITADRMENWQQYYTITEATYSEVQIVMHSCTNVVNGVAGNGWPAIAEFEIYGSEAEVIDPDNIALKCDVHASSGRTTAKNITDGSKNSAWRGTYYPAYVDIDLEKNYKLDTVEVFTPENGYSQYTIYTSVDGRNFDKLAEKTSTNSATLEAGESYNANGKEARIVRVYVEYNSAETAAIINEVRVTGTESNTPVQERPAIAVVDFEESEYADADGNPLTVTADDTYEEVYGIIGRRLGEKYKEWFTLELGQNPKNNGYDFFELSTVNGKVHVKGNDGVSLATGINHFLKYYCNVNISQVGDQVKMPENVPAINETVHKETKAKVRYSYNYCTLSYSMAFWGKDEWRNELDWLALNGVNVVLDATAQEEVWRRFLGELGYSHEEAKDFIAGPAYYAWAYMANLSGFGGPVHDSWFEERTALARENQLIMRKLGMQPVLQGYSGMVPTDILDYATEGDYALASSDIIAQGEWCGFTRPSMLRTTNAAFYKYAKLFYECQKAVYGDVSDYYATDPFHEGGVTAGMNPSDIAEKVLNSMLTADQDGIWIIQAWQGNPTTALLKGLDRITNGAQHALVLDLYAEKDPHYNQTGNSYGETNEFDDTPWLFCMLNNFGGRLGLHGHLDNLAEDIPAAMNSSDHMAGIGITPEASVNNPVLYDFLFETVWQDDATKDLKEIVLDSWLDDYATRRYGAESDSANQAWDILKETVYKSNLNNLGQGAPESVVNARPALNISAASSWGNAVISYDKVELEKAAKLLLEDYDVLAGSKGYMYDVANVLQQVLSNSAQEYHKKMVAAYNSRNAEEFEKQADVFMDIIDSMETVTGTTEYFMLGRWVEQAKALAKNADDFTKELYELNAKALVTTWGSYNQTHGGQNLKDYSNRQWSGLIGDFYKERWELWIDARTKELKGESYTDVDDWFPWEWNWVRSNTVYPTTATPADLKTLGLEIIEKYTSANPAADDSRDIPLEKYVVMTAGSTQSGNSTGSATDNNYDTYWEATWGSGGGTCANLWYQIELEEATEIEALRYYPRWGENVTGNGGDANGFITAYRVEVSSDGTTWEEAAEGKWVKESGWKIAEFDEAKTAKYVRLIATGTNSANGDGKEMSIAEIRLKGVAEAEETVDKTALAAAIAAADALVGTTYSADSWNALQAALSEAKTVNNNEAATAEDVANALANLQNAQNALQMAVYAEKDVFVKVGETVSILDTTGSYTENGLKELDTKKATVEVETKTIQDYKAYLFDAKSSNSAAVVDRYSDAESGGTIDLSDCLYFFDQVGEDTYYISGVAQDGETTKQVYLNPHETDNLYGIPNTTSPEQIKIDTVKAEDQITVTGFKFLDQDINKTTSGNYCLQFAHGWGVFNENTNLAEDANPKETVFQLYELLTDGTYGPVAEIQDGGMYIIAAPLENDEDNRGFVLRPSFRIPTKENDPARNDHVAKWVNDTRDNQVNGVEITGVSSGDTSVIVGTTKYNIHVLNEKDITIKTGESVRIFDQSGTFKESGRDALDPTIAEANVEAQSFTDDVAKLYQYPSYNGKTIGLSECIYTFNRNADGSYNIVAVASTGETVYLNPFIENTQSKKGYPNRTDSERITIQKTDQGFVFLEDTKKANGEIATENYRLTFVNDWKIFNEDPVNDNGTPYTGDKTDAFTLYQVGKDGDSYTCTAVDDMAGIIDGGQYVIAANVNGTEYILRPSASTENRNDHVAQRYSEEAITVAGNEVVISGVSVGDTKLTVGNTVYSIHVVQNEQYVELSKNSSLTVTGTSVTLESGREYVTITKQNGENQYQIMAEELGEATVIIDKEIYHITVVEEELASGVGRSDGMVVNRLTMSANNTFELCVINSNTSGDVEWLVIDKETGKEATWANVVDGKVSAKNPADQEEHNGIIVAKLSDGTEVTIELKLTPAPTSEPLRLYDVYVEDLHHTDVYYGWIYEYDNPENPVGEKLYGSTDLTQVVEGEVIYVSMGANYKNALDFFAKPEEGYALTQMRSTDSAGHYKRLNSTTPEETEFIATPTVAGHVQYHQINGKATADLVQKAIDKGCHGAQGFTKLYPNETLYTILNYRSEKLPTVEKTVYGIGTGNDFRPYEEGVTAEIGEYVYFKIEVETYPITGEYFDENKNPLSDAEVVKYDKVELIDKMMSAENAVFIPFENIGKENPFEGNVGSVKEITQDILSEEELGQVHEYYVVYQITEADVKNSDFKVKNTVNLNCIYESYYSSGEYDSKAESDAEIYITTQLMKNLVVDFGLPVSYVPILKDPFVNVPDGATEASETVLAKYGEAKITTSVDDGNYTNTVVYTPTSPLREVDAIPIAVNGVAYKIEVYPATTVYYEEDFANYTSGLGWTFPAGETQISSQTPQYLEETSEGNYGYDKKYAVEAAGPSNASEAVSTAAGDTAEFTFKGDGIDIYANCQSEHRTDEGVVPPTGTVSVLIKDKDGAIEKLLIVNTKIAGNKDGVTDVQNEIENAYNMPIVSVNGLSQGEHIVKIVHTRSKEEADATTAANEGKAEAEEKVVITYPVRLDGFRVYNTLSKSEHSVYDVHNEANPNYVEMRNVVLNALNISSLYDGKKENGESDYAEDIYAEDIAGKLIQVLDEKENGSAAIVLDKTENPPSASDYVSGNAQDLLDNGPKNELFLYENQTLTFELKAGLQNVQIGLKAVNGAVSLEGDNAYGVTVTKAVANTDGTITSMPIVQRDISSSADMFYVIGDITEDATITIANNSSHVLSVTDLKYFVGVNNVSVFGDLTEDNLVSVLAGMGYRLKAEVETPEDDTKEPIAPIPEGKGADRISGKDRYATAYGVAEEYKKQLDVKQFDSVIITTGEKYADALSGSYLAVLKNAPILLTNAARVAEVAAYVKENLKEEGMVYILGGEAAVPEEVDELLNADYTVKRLSGKDRYETNRAILEEAGVQGRELLIATGEDFADSLSASATGRPILLVKDEVTDAHRAILRKYDGSKIYIIGGERAVSAEIEEALVGHGRIFRVNGANRFETSVEVAKKFFEKPAAVTLAYAFEAPDGLCGGPLAALVNAPLILTENENTAEAKAYVQEMGIDSGYVFGGTGRISEKAVEEIF